MARNFSRCMIETISLQIASYYDEKLPSALSKEYFTMINELWTRFINEWEFNSTPTDWKTIKQSKILLVHNFEILINQLFTTKIYSSTNYENAEKWRALNNCNNEDFKKNASKLCREAITEYNLSYQSISNIIN